MINADLSRWIIPDWPAPASVNARVTTRIGNYCVIGPNVASLTYKYDQLIDELGLPSPPRVLKQVHGINIINLANYQPLIEADAAFTYLSNQVCCVLTADCLPILLCDKQGSVIAAIHAGWRSLAMGIVERTIAQLAVASNTLLAWLGPAIGPQHFFVQSDVVDCFCKRQPLFQQGFTRYDATHWLADIFQLARIALRLSGVDAIFGGTLCTVSQPELFYSYRREQGVTGRLINLVWLS